MATITLLRTDLYANKRVVNCDKNSSFFPVTIGEIKLKSKSMLRARLYLQVFFVPCLCILCFLISCRSASNSSNKDVATKYGTAVPEKSIFNATRSRGGAVRFDFTFQVPHDTSSASFNLLFNISNAYCVVIDPAFGVLDTIDIPIATGITSIDPTKDSLIVSSNGFWLNATSHEFSELILDVNLEVNNKMYHETRLFSMEPTKEEEKAMTLVSVVPSVDDQNDSTITFALLATRNRGGSVDYFTSSEKMRIEILDSKGRELYNSSLGKNFLQEVLPVDPLKKGDNLRYTSTWNYVLNNRRVLEPGDYIARLSLVTKPLAYVASIPFSWKGRQP